MRTGRPPTGTGYRSLLLTARATSGYQLSIGRTVWQALGKPGRIDLAVADGKLWLRPGHRHAVSGQRWNTRPKTTISHLAARQLGLDPEPLLDVELPVTLVSGGAYAPLA